MVIIMVIENENKEIEQLIRELARKLLEEKQVDVIIGYTEGTVPLSSSPIVIDKAEEVDKLTWNNLCYINLAKYLVPRISTLMNKEGQRLKVGIVSKGCVGRALIHLSVEHQLDLENIKIIGIPCNGVINRRRIEKELEEMEALEISVSEEKIIVKCKQKKNLKSLASLLSGLGFTKIAYQKGSLTIEKTKGRDLRGQPYLEYRVEFKGEVIEFTYSLSAKRSKNARLLELMPTFLNILQVAEDYYDIQPTQLFSHINTVLLELSKIVDRDAVDGHTALFHLLPVRFRAGRVPVDDLGVYDGIPDIYHPHELFVVACGQQHPDAG